MKNNAVISRKNLPVKFPVSSTVIAFLLLDKFNAAGWVWGAFGVLFFIIWACAIFLLVTEEDVDILKKYR